MLRRGRDSYEITLIMALLSCNILSAFYLRFAIEISVFSLLIRILIEVEGNKWRQRSFSLHRETLIRTFLRFLQKSDTLRWERERLKRELNWIGETRLRHGSLTNVQFKMFLIRNVKVYWRKKRVFLVRTWTCKNQSMWMKIKELATDFWIFQLVFDIIWTVV